MVQRTGFEPAKHYALGPHPSPFDRSGTSAYHQPGTLMYFKNDEYFYYSKDTLSFVLITPSIITEAYHLDQPGLFFSRIRV